MKSVAIFAGLSAIGLVAAVPSKHRGHGSVHDAVKRLKRQAPAVVTEYEYVTEMVAKVTVYVDEAGKTVSVDRPTAPATFPVSWTRSRKATTTSKSTTTTVAPVPTTTPSTTTTTTTTEAPPPAAATVAPEPAPAAETVAVAPPVAVPETVAPASNSNDPTSFRGVAYSPYKGTYGQNVDCKSAGDVQADFAMIDASRWDVVRIYGTDCNQVANVLAAAKPKGIKIFAGVYEPTNWRAEVDILAAAVGGNWDSIHTISIGNEAVHKGMSADTVLSSLGAAKSYLRSIGYNGWVVAVDTFMVAKSDPRICQASDYTAVNMHPYWDYNTASNEAGTFMVGQIAEVKALCGSDKPLVISETGWPSSGATKGKAIASKSDQSAAISSITGALGKGYVLLAAFDDWWKNPGPDGVEQMFGLMGTAPSG